MTQYIDIVVGMYGWWGIALMVATLLFFIIQLRYYIFCYGKIAKYKNSAREVIRESTPKVSVVIPMFTDDYPFLEERLPMIMAQERVEFEVVLVYIGTNNDFYDDMQRLQQVLPNVVVTKIQSNPRFPISIKTALNVGVKAANNEHMIFTSTECYPLSDKWLSLMASGFKRGDLVIGYTGLEPKKGLGQYIMRISRMMGSVNWISRAIKGRPYRGHRTNIGWTKSMYYEARGFSHLNMNIGEDDLFVQRLLSSENAPKVSIILTPQATLNQVCWGGVSWWTEQMRYFRSSFALYPFGAKSYERWERRSRLLFFVAAVAAMIFMPLEIKIAAAVLVVLRIIMVAIAVKNIAKRLGEDGVVMMYGLFDIVSPIYMTFLDVWLRLSRDPKVWR
ncbi:MAG: glycosyltransferase [Rikenellaceae bacterium]